MAYANLICSQLGMLEIDDDDDRRTEVGISLDLEYERNFAKKGKR